MSVLDEDFNRAVLDITASLLPHGFDVSHHAPSTYRQLRSHMASTGRLVVYSGASDRTIYDDPKVNFAFRAWHDFCHLEGGHDTNLAGEIEACRLQCQRLVLRYGENRRTGRWQRIVEAEIIGQALYFERHGRFPVDQALFVRVYLHDQDAALSISPQDE